MKLLTNYLSNTDFDNAIANGDMGYPNTSFIQETSALHFLNKIDYSAQYFCVTPSEDTTISIKRSGTFFYNQGQYLYTYYSVDECKTWDRTPTDAPTDYVEVFVDGEKWTQAASLYDMTEDSKEYVISVGYENEMDIMFGALTYLRASKTLIQQVFKVRK